MTERDETLLSFEKEIRRLKETSENLKIILNQLKNREWYKIKWEFIDSGETRQFFFGTVGKMNAPYFYIRQELDGVYNEIILSKQQIEELYGDMQEYLK